MVESLESAWRFASMLIAAVGMTISPPAPAGNSVIIRMGFAG